MLAVFLDSSKIVEFWQSIPDQFEFSQQTNIDLSYWKRFVICSVSIVEYLNLIFLQIFDEVFLFRLILLQTFTFVRIEKRFSTKRIFYEKKSREIRRISVLHLTLLKNTKTNLFESIYNSPNLNGRALLLNKFSDRIRFSTRPNSLIVYWLKDRVFPNVKRNKSMKTNNYCLPEPKNELIVRESVFSINYCSSFLVEKSLNSIRRCSKLILTLSFLKAQNFPFHSRSNVHWSKMVHRCSMFDNEIFPVDQCKLLRYSSNRTDLNLFEHRNAPLKTNHYSDKSTSNSSDHRDKSNNRTTDRRRFVNLELSDETDRLFDIEQRFAFDDICLISVELKLVTKDQPFDLIDRQRLVVKFDKSTIVLTTFSFSDIKKKTKQQRNEPIPVYRLIDASFFVRLSRSFSKYNLQLVIENQSSKNSIHSSF